MTTSGTVTAFNPNRSEILRQAALHVGAVSANVPMNATQESDFTFLLNSMIVEWATRGIKVWTVQEAILFPVSGQRDYTIGHATTSLNAHCCDARRMVTTTLSADEAAGQTTLSVTSDDGITDAWQIGVMLESGDFHWSTVDGTPAGDVVAIDDALPSAAVAGARVFVYPSNIEKPLRITEARRVEIASLRRVPFVRMYARKDFMELPDADTDGVPYAPYYDRQIVAGYLSFIPPPVAPLVDVYGFTWHRGIETMEAASNTADFPQEWIRCLTWNLAAEMLARYPNAARASVIEKRAMESLAEMAGVDREEESVFFQPEPYGGYSGPWTQR